MLNPPYSYCTDTTARLVAKTRAYLVMSVSERTIQVLLSTLKKYRHFCEKYLIANQPESIIGSLPSTPEIVSYWLTHLASAKDHKIILKFSTISHYLNNFKSLHSKLGYTGENNPCSHRLCLQTLKGIQRAFWIYEPERLKMRIRKALTPDLLALVGSLLANKSCDIRQSSLWAALNCAVWGMMRPGEIGFTSMTRYQKLHKVLLVSSLYWIVKGDGMELRIREEKNIKKKKNNQWEIREERMNYEGWEFNQIEFAIIHLSNSKTAQFSSEQIVRIAGYRPLSALWNYLKLRNQIYPTQKSNFLFVSDWKLIDDQIIEIPMSYHYLLESMRKYLSQLGLNSKEFGGHSGRRGGATTMANAGINKDVIKQLGRWKSDAINAYIEPDQQLMIDAIRLLADEPYEFNLNLD